MHIEVLDPLQKGIFQGRLVNLVEEFCHPIDISERRECLRPFPGELATVVVKGKWFQRLIHCTTQRFGCQDAGNRLCWKMMIDNCRQVARPVPRLAASRSILVRLHGHGG